MIDCCFFRKYREEEQLIRYNYQNKSEDYIINKLKINESKKNREFCLAFIYISSSITSALSTCISGGTTSLGTVPATIVSGTAALNSFSNYLNYENKKTVLKEILKKLPKKF